MSQLRVRELNSVFGAEVEGLEPPAELDDETCKFLRGLFDDRGLLLFRGLDIDQSYQTYLAHVLIAQASRADDDTVVSGAMRDPLYVSNKEAKSSAPYGRLLFHSDMMWSEQPCLALSLYGVEVEQPVSPTVFASTANAWDTLPDELRAQVEDLSAVHGHDTSYPKREEDDPDVLVTAFERPQMTTTPVAHRHPRTGRTLLYVSQQMTREVVGLDSHDSEDLLEALFAHLYNPANLLEHEWRAGDLVIWDNLAVQHARPNVRADGPVRTLRKVFAPVPSKADHIAMPSFSKAG